MGYRTDISSARHGPPCVRWRRATACGPSTTRGCVPRWRRPDARRHATVPQSWMQRENWEFETHRRTPMATFRIRPGLRKSDPNPNSSRSLAVRRGARWRGRRKTISCCLSRRFSAITARTPPEPHSVAGHDGQVKQGEQEVLHARDSVGQTSGATPRGLNPGFSDKIGNSRRTGAVGGRSACPAWPR